MSYDISRERKNELEKFCIDNLIGHKLDTIEKVNKSIGVRYLETRSINREVIESSAKKASSELWNYILKSIAYELTYSEVNPPCSRKVFYNRVKKFYWLLDKELYFKKEKKLWKNKSD